MATQSETDHPLRQLSERESEILRKAGERVFALSKRLAEKERETNQMRSEAASARELLAESREVRRVLSDQIQSLQQALDREYEERSELRRLLASLHMQMQELLPIVAGLSKDRSLPPPPTRVEMPGQRTGTPRDSTPSLARRLFAAAGELAGNQSSRKRRR